MSEADEGYLDFHVAVFGVYRDEWPHAQTLALDDFRVTDSAAAAE